MSIQRIRIEFIDHNRQAYETAGNWTFLPDDQDPDMLIIHVSSMGDLDMQISCAIHELIEARRCLKDGVSQDDVTRFDEKCLMENREGEPGDAEDSPYRRQHEIATDVERVVADALDLNWMEYSAKVDSLKMEER